MTASERLIALEHAVGELGDKLQGIGDAERFRAQYPFLATFVTAHREREAAARAAHAEANPKPAVDFKARYAPVKAESWHP